MINKAVSIEGQVGAVFARPRLGTVVAFRVTACEELAGIPARIVGIGPLLGGGDYLVRLEYAGPVKYGTTFLRQIDALFSELCRPTRLLSRQ